MSDDCTLNSGAMPPPGYLCKMRKKTLTGLCVKLKGYVDEGATATHVEEDELEQV